MWVDHIITRLDHGAAEAVLCHLVCGSSSCEHIVVSMLDEGVYGQKLRECGVNVQILNMYQLRYTLSGVFKLYKFIRNSIQASCKSLCK